MAPASKTTTSASGGSTSGAGRTGGGTATGGTGGGTVTGGTTGAAVSRSGPADDRAPAIAPMNAKGQVPKPGTREAQALERFKNVKPYEAPTVPPSEVPGTREYSATRKFAKLAKQQSTTDSEA